MGYGAASASSSGFTLYTEANSDGTNLAALGFDSTTTEADAKQVIDFEVTGTTGAVDLMISPTYSVTDVSTDPTAGFAQPGTLADHGAYVYVYDSSGQEIFSTIPANDPLFVPLVGGVVYRLDVWENAVTGVKLSTGNAHSTTALSFELSALTVPEPGTDLLLGIALAAVSLGGFDPRTPRGS